MTAPQNPLNYEPRKQDREPPDFWILAVAIGVALLGLGGILLLGYFGK